MILKLIVSPGDMDSIPNRVTSLLGRGWVSHYRITTSSRFHKPGSKYDYYWEGGFWSEDNHFDDLVLYEKPGESMVVTMYVETQEDREAEEAALSDAQSLLDGLPRP